MNLVLMRHGNASYHSTKDEWRQLSEDGQKQVARQALKAAKLSIPWNKIRQILVSPYTRTQQTGLELTNACPPENGLLQTQYSAPELVPEGECHLVQEMLLNKPQTDTLLITHQPLISRLIGYFCDGEEHARYPMMPGSIVWLKGDVFAKKCMSVQTFCHDEF